MINIFNNLEDLNCTNLYQYEKELKDLIKEVVNDFLESNKNIEYQFISNSHLIFENEEEEEEY